jgi:hypothetical protein
VHDPRAAKGFEHFYNLEYDQAIGEFRKLAAAEPANPNFHNHVAQAVLYREMLRGGALESELVSGTNPFLGREKLNTSPEAQKEFDAALGRAIQLATERTTANPNDVAALYSLGVSYGCARTTTSSSERRGWTRSRTLRPRGRLITEWWNSTPGSPTLG